MKKNLLAFLSLAVVTFGCGEAGIQSDISQVAEIDPIEVSLEVPPGFVGVPVAQTPERTVQTDNINISSDEFDEYLEDVQKFTINKIWYTVENFNSPNEGDLEVEMNIVFSGQASQNLLSTTIQDLQTITGDVQLYDKASPGDVNAAAISDLEAAMKNGDSFRIELVLVGKDVTLHSQQVDFGLIFKFDVTARVQLD